MRLCYNTHTMKLDEKKKAREKMILNHVYQDHDYTIVPSERPDFILQAKVGGEPFGVEITELYLSEAHAKAVNLQMTNGPISVPRYESYKAKILEVIADKNQKSMEYRKDVSYLELIIDDREKRFTNDSEDFLRLLQESEHLQQVIKQSNFKRIYVLSKYQNAPIVLALEANNEVEV
ncbi:hypothetical protein A4S06_09045 [Erysipelotrichaceae bacterium MTC7]|nr:hypothetical protein A4S06_09045 [Erysipelotrichaceae bacterium MTC7]